jgi:DNA polymerase-3 subunit gamma/tau
VKFIFATTEVHKILPTILSRCQRFDLRPIPTEIIVQHLQHIASQEGVTLDPSAAWAIAKGADGGMRDAQSMLDQLVAFCGNQITEPDVLNIFGFTSRETIASLCEAIFEKQTAAALQIIQREATTGRDVSQLLHELIGALRAIIVSKVDPQAPNEGIPQEIWQKLLESAKSCKADRLLAVIDVFADTEGRMKWANNRRLHLELGVIKAIQVVSEARISDIIHVLAASAGQFPDTSVMVPSTLPETPAPIVSSHQVIEAPAVTPVAVEVTPAPVATTPVEEKPAAPEPAPVPVKKTTDPFAALDAMIDTAEDRPEPPSAPPAAVVAAAAPAAPAPVKETPREMDDFHKDPLIQKALEIFSGKIVTP